jgi:cyclase
MTLVLRSLLLVAALSGSALTIAEDRLASVVIETIPLSDKLYMISGAGGNIAAFVGDDGMLLVDDDYAPVSDKLKEALSHLGPALPTFVLNTHYHADHTGGNNAFTPDSVIMAHDNVRTRLVGSDTALPVVTYEARAHIYFNGDDIRLHHFPASHTDGDTVVFFPASNVVHTGDLFWNGLFPFIDVQAGGSLHGLINSISTLRDMTDDDTHFIPGHGDLAHKADLDSFHQMLLLTQSFIKTARDKGQSLDHISESGLPGQWESWGLGYISEQRWIQTVYNSLDSEQP